MNLTYNICVIDIGSPKLGNIGWCFIDRNQSQSDSGTDLDGLFDRFQERALFGGLGGTLICSSAS